MFLSSDPLQCIRRLLVEEILSVLDNVHDVQYLDKSQIWIHLDIIRNLPEDLPVAILPLVLRGFALYALDRDNVIKCLTHCYFTFYNAGIIGFEPMTNRLTVYCATAAPYSHHVAGDGLEPPTSRL